ncbi:MAG: hypothetical protein AAF297_01560 [Planctomycetota bacterium]
MTADTAIQATLEAVRNKAAEAKVFGEITLAGDRLEAAAANSAEPAEYRLETDQDKLWVVLVMKDRWLSEAIEAGLRLSGDSLDELLEEELVELGLELTDADRPLVFEHFRSDDMLFTFRTPIQGVSASAGDADRIATFLLGYEATFRQLGDMDADDED